MGTCFPGGPGINGHRSEQDHGGPHAHQDDVYLGLALAAEGTLVGVLVIVPRRFATTAGATASVGARRGWAG